MARPAFDQGAAQGRFPRQDFSLDAAHDRFACQRQGRRDGPPGQTDIDQAEQHARDRVDDRRTDVGPLPERFAIVCPAVDPGNVVAIERSPGTVGAARALERERARDGTNGIGGAQGADVAFAKYDSAAGRDHGQQCARIAQFALERNDCALDYLQQRAFILIPAGD